MSVEVLQEHIRITKNPTMAALSPSMAEIPAFIHEQAQAQYGCTLKAAAHAYRTFCYGILDALQGLVPAISVVSGCFSALGADGVQAMQDVLQYASNSGYYVLLDLMRGDLGITASALAASCFGSIPVGDAAFTPYPCDGILISGYLGTDSVEPFTRYCTSGKNVFIVARSSNKSAREVQDLLSGDRIVHQVMADLAMRWSNGLFTGCGYSEIGIAVGATNPQVLHQLRKKYDRLFFLVPGYGAQGASASDAQFAFDSFGHGACILAGRSILYAYMKQNAPAEEYRRCARESAEQMREKILQYTTIL